MTTVLRDIVTPAGDFRLSVDRLDIADGERIVVFGSTGSGKTVLLDTLAGLRRPGSGTILVDDTDITHLPPERRNVGYVQQGPSLFPHLSVAENIAYGLARLPRSERAPRVAMYAELAGVAGLLGRTPRDLSGGETQRVALARALAVHPRLVLLDEPLSALDAPGREETRAVMRRVFDEVRPTVVHVTHDLDEAIGMADRIVIMAGGRVLQTGGPEEVLFAPTTPEVARLMGARNVLACVVTGDDAVLEGGRRIPLRGARSGPAWLVVRAEDVSITPADGSAVGDIQLPAVVTALEPRSADVLLTLDIGTRLDARIPRREFETPRVAEGDRVIASFSTERMRVIEDVVT